MTGLAPARRPTAVSGLRSIVRTALVPCSACSGRTARGRARVEFVEEARPRAPSLHLSCTPSSQKSGHAGSELSLIRRNKVAQGLRKLTAKVGFEAKLHHGHLPDAWQVLSRLGRSGVSATGPPPSSAQGSVASTAACCARSLARPFEDFVPSRSTSSCPPWRSGTRPSK